MYNELYDAWKRELQNRELEKLSSDFYSRVADYVRRLREETRMLDKRTVKASLLKKEVQNAKHMVRELVRSRCRKIIKILAEGEKVSSDVLTPEEDGIFKATSPVAEMYQSFTRSILRGQPPKVEVEQKHKRVPLRFLKDVPPIIGADMKTYGPFKIEDVASLPVENAKILSKQGLAEMIEA
jgi:DNA replication factor GINS